MSTDEAGMNSGHGDQPGSAADEDALLLAALSRRPEVLADLYTRWAPRLTGLIRAAGVPDHAVADVLQTTFTDVWRSAARFDGRRGTARAWIFQIARRRTLDWLRAERPGRVTPLDPVDLPDPAADPVERAALAEGLAALSERERDLLRLAYHGGFTTREIADLWGVPVGTVKTWSHRALAKLRQVLQTESDAP
jgi:RNA polymerase sigma-70 factor (ECF subfamily)